MTVEDLANVTWTSAIANETIAALLEAEEPVTMKEALEVIHQSLSGEDTTVAFAALDAILTEDEKQALAELPAQEQMSLVLAVLTQDDSLIDSENASDELKAAYQAITERIASLNADEATAFMTALAENFFGVDGEELIIDILVTRDGVQTAERYIFKQVDENWVLNNVQTGSL